MMIQRLPRQPGRLRRLLDRRAPKAWRRNTRMAASRMRSRGASFDDFDEIDEMSNDGFVLRVGNRPRAAADRADRTPAS